MYIYVSIYTYLCTHNISVYVYMSTWKIWMLWYLLVVIEWLCLYSSKTENINVLCTMNLYAYIYIYFKEPLSITICHHAYA